MAYSDKITTSKHGRRLGLQLMSSAATGRAGNSEFLVGPDQFRAAASTAEVAVPAVDGVASSLAPFGYTIVGSTIGGTYTYPLQAPIPGTGPRVIASPSTDAKVLIRVGSSIGAAAPALLTSAGSTFTTVTLSSQGGSITLVPLTTALWSVVNGSTLTGNSFTTTT